MTPQIPAHVRAWLYWAATLLAEVGGVVTATVSIVGAASPDYAVPYWVPIVAGVALMLSGRLHALAGRNVDT